METNRFKLARTKYNQHGHQSVKEVAAATGITRSLIDDLESNSNETKRGVSYMKIATLAKHYGVSSDYLLSLSETPSVKEDIQSICKTTGLSEGAIEFLKREHSSNLLYWHMDAINFLLENESFQLFLDMMIGFGTSLGGEIPYKVESNGLAPIVTDTDIFRAKSVDLLGSILSDSKKYFSAKKDTRWFYVLQRSKGEKEGQ